MNTEDRLRELGFIIKHPLRLGINRVPTQDHPHNKNGWIKLCDHSVTYGDWSEGIERGWFSLNNLPPMSDEDRREYFIQKEREAQLSYEWDIELRIADATIEWAGITSNKTTHDYLSRKQALLHNGVKIFNNELLIPMYTTKRSSVVKIKDLQVVKSDGRYSNIINYRVSGHQIIYADGAKRFVPGSVLSGSFFPILQEGKKIIDCDVIYLVEGYATGSSVMQAIGYGACVVVCFSCGNIDKVYEVMKEYRKPVYVIKDNDNAGLKIKAHGFTVGDVGEDANDVHVKSGLFELRKRIYFGTKNTGV